MSRWRLPLLAILLAALLVGIGWVVGRWRRATPPSSPPVASERGALLFQVHCASCHGTEGHGDGTSAADLRPPPRSFAARPWRFAVTPESIQRVTLDGIAGTAMPSFRLSLSASELEAVAAHVHQLATGEPVVEQVPPEEERLLRAAGFTALRGAEPPALTLSAADGSRVTLSDLRGQLVLLHFWGTGCLHCIKEMPALTALQKTHAGRLTLLHICTDEDAPVAAQKILDRLAPGTISYTESNGVGLARFEVQVLPTVWLIGPEGKAIARVSGAQDWQSPALSQVLSHWLPPSVR